MVSLIWIMTGIVLFGAMIAGAIRLWIKRRRESLIKDTFGETKPSDQDSDSFT